jgi:hypothetical protein
MHARTTLCMGLIVAIGAAVSFHLASVRPAAAQLTPANESVLARFTGTDDDGNLQAALEDALLQADAYFEGQGSDIRYDYRVVRTAGQRGGFVWMNEISVTIAAAMQER